VSNEHYRHILHKSHKGGPAINRSTRAKLYATDVPGYVYIIRTQNKYRPYYIGSTRRPKYRWYQHKSYGELEAKGGQLCSFIQFSTMKEAYTFEYALHHHIKAEGYDGLSSIVEYAEGIWEEGELNLERLDTVVQTALNRKMVARVARNMQQHGASLRSMSELLREVFLIHNAILDQQGVETIDTTEEADAILKDMFDVKLNPGDKYLKSFLKNLQEESGRVEADEMKFNSIPMPRGRHPKWTESDEARLQKAVMTPKMQEMLDKLRKENNQ